MCMVIRISSHFSFYYFIIIISRWIFKCHTSIESIHKLLIFFSTMVTSSVFPHHISNSSSFCHSEVFYVIINLFISSLYLSYNRQNVNGLEVDDLHRLIILCN